MITISLCMIVKNEASTIGNCLESVLGIADEINIVDTGSTDGTKDIVRQYTDRIFDFEWIDDFAAARNYAFQQATMSHILWLDADDVLLEADRQKLLQLKQSLDDDIHSVTMIYHYAFDDHGNVTVELRRNRLVQRHCNFQWHGPVHEYLAVHGKTLNSDVIITHCRVHQHSDRNIRIFENRLARGEQFSSRDMYYYANELMDHQRYELAAQQYHQFLDTGAGWVEDNISSCLKLADIYHQRNEEQLELQMLWKSFDYAPPRAEACCRLGAYKLHHDELTQAIFWYTLATKLTKPESLGFFDDAYWTWIPHVQLCVCYYRLGNFELSYDHNEVARHYRPNDESIRNNKAILEDLYVHN
ncbi:glycosyltransferase [Paenibacillus sp. GCM10027629]|uniref:tetratricopeptide repeat-containing glycosyltransferase family 2 protein n=1 Tax=Paenibacillus sp. GCM10027629 TaxID=3273414 RepID=UPI0036426F4A